MKKKSIILILSLILLATFIYGFSLTSNLNFYGDQNITNASNIHSGYYCEQNGTQCYSIAGLVASGSGDITSVTAGNCLVGGGTTGAVTLGTNDSCIENSINVSGSGSGNCSVSGSCAGTGVAYMDYNNAGYFNVTGNLSAGKFWASTLGFTLTDDGSNLILTTDVSGNNYFEIGTDGAYMDIYSNPNPANGYEMVTFTETQGADTNINIYEGGTGHNRLWSSGSVRVGGDEDYLCSNLTSMVDCDTSATGADLVVQDDIWLGGLVMTNNWSNASITESQISDLGDYVISSQLNKTFITNSTINVSIDLRVTVSFLQNLLDTVYTGFTYVNNAISGNKTDNQNIISNWISGNKTDNQNIISGWINTNKTELDATDTMIIAGISSNKTNNQNIIGGWNDDNSTADRAYTDTRVDSIHNITGDPYLNVTKTPTIDTLIKSLNFSNFNYTMGRCTTYNNGSHICTCSC